MSDSKFGKIVTDSSGRTVYLFINDKPNEPSCTGGCATTWPPVGSVNGARSNDDTLNERIGTTTSGGTEQVEVASHPLYYFSGDTAPGQINGQGSGGAWFVVRADGSPVTD